MSPFAEIALALGIAVCVPLGLVAVRRDDPWLRRVAPFEALATLAALIAMLLPAGEVAAGVALIWLGFSVSCAIHALRGAIARSTFRLEEALVDAACTYLVVGGAWFVIWRSGGAVDLGAHGPLLTAVHFHLAGYASLVLAGLSARVVRTSHSSAWPRLRAVFVGALIGPAAVALGILSGSVLEQVAAVVFALATAVVAWATLRYVAPAASPRSAAMLMRVSALSAGAAMALVWVYAGAPFITGAPFLDISTMARTHGMLNSLGYVLLGLLAWVIASPVGSAFDGPPPFSSLSSRGRVGADFFERRALTAPGRASGLVDSLDEYASSDFVPAMVNEQVRGFYEQTSAFDLTLFPHWRGIFRSLAGGYAGISARIEQVHYAIAREAGDVIESRIIPLDARADGRPGVRGWVRWYKRTGRSIYVAAYATHRDKLRTYMNIAFPLPGGNLASILRPANNGSGGLTLTSLPDARRPGHEGVYFASRVPMRLPIDETINVWRIDDPDAPADLVARRRPGTVAVARHDAWLFGFNALTLDYTIEQIRAIGSPAHR